MGSKTTDTARAKGLDREKIEAISKMQQDQAAPELARYLLQEVMRRKEPRDMVCYTHMRCSPSGHPLDVGREKITQAAAVAGVANVNTSPSNPMTDRKGGGRTVRGQYRITVKNLSPAWSYAFTFTHGVPGEPVWSHGENKMVATTVPRDLNMPFGFLDVAPDGDPFLHAFLELHPQNCTAPSMHPEQTEPRGFTVTAEKHFNRGWALFLPDGAHRQTDTEIQKSATSTRRTVDLANKSDKELIAICRVMGFTVNEHLSSSPRDQMMMKIRDLLDDAGGRRADRQQQLFDLLDGGENHVRDIVEKAWEMGVVEFDGGYYINTAEGKREDWPWIICPVGEAGFEREFLVAALSENRDQAKINAMDTAIVARQNDLLRAKDEFAAHDRLIDGLVADGNLYRNPSMKQWMVKVKGGSGQMVVKLDPKASEDDQAEKLRAWARTMTYDKLMDKLGAMVADPEE